MTVAAPQISYNEPKTNDFFRSLVICLTDSHWRMLVAVKQEKVGEVWSSHVVGHDTFLKTGFV